MVALKTYRRRHDPVVGDTRVEPGENPLGIHFAMFQPQADLPGHRYALGEASAVPETFEAPNDLLPAPDR
jgi:hypothetical protein